MLTKQSQSMRAKAYGSVLFSAIETASKLYLVKGFWRKDIYILTDRLAIRKHTFDRFVEWNACLLHMFERLKAIFHQAEFSARSDIFFCLKTNWRRVGVERQKKISFRTENSAQWKTALKATFHSIFDIPMRPAREDQKHRRRFTR